MSFRGLIVGAVLFAALAGGVWWSVNKDTKVDTAGTGPKSDSPKLVSIKDDDVNRVEIRQRDSSEPVVVQREKSGWTMTSPKQVAVDSDAVNGVVSSVTGLTWDRLVEDKPSDLQAFGLATPAAKVTVNAKDGKKTTLLLGDDTPAGSSVYAKLDGDPRVFSVSTGVKSGVVKNWRDLRDKRLITVDDTKVSRVEMKTGSNSVEFGRSGQNEWQVLKPKPMRADGYKVEDLVRKVHDAKLNSGISEDDEKKYASDFATGSRVAAVSLTDPSGTQTLELRKKGDDYYAKSSIAEEIAKVDKDVGDAVSKPLDDFRAKKLFDFGFSEPSKIDIRNDTKTYSFSKSGDKWWSNGKQMDPTSVQSLIDKLRDMQAIKLLDSGFTSPFIDITVVSNDGKRTEKVSIAKKENSWLGKRENDSTVYELDGKKVEEIQTAADDVKAPPPAASAPSKK